MAADFPHRRYNPLMDCWVIVSPQRLKRPWQGSVEKVAEKKIESYDPNNPLCPNSLRPSGEKNPNYESTYVFTNDFPALVPNCPPPPTEDQHVLFRSEPASGTCKVMCFDPRSDLQLATMSKASVRTVIDAWAEETNELGKQYDWVQVFENKGAIMGCSNPHPHCQIWCCNFLPNEAATKERTQKEYYNKYGVPLLVDYVKQELERKERIVVENPHWVVIVPYWAVWPFETILLPKSHVKRFYELTNEQRDSLADITKQLLVKYDNLFATSFPYSMGWQGAPTGKYLGTNCDHWQLHAVYLPPLLRSATVKKFMAGFELVCEPQRDLLPEKAAEMLRNLSGDIHYLDEHNSENIS